MTVMIILLRLELPLNEALVEVELARINVNHVKESAYLTRSVIPSDD